VETIVRIKVLSELLSSDELVSVIDLVPDRSWNIGDFRLKTGIVEKTNGIIIDSGVSRDESLKKHLDAIVAKLAPVQKNFIVLAKECTIQLSIVYYSDYCNPGLCIDKEFVQFIASIHADIDMDGYVLDSDD
jgi:hypothetical protein